MRPSSFIAVCSALVAAALPLGAFAQMAPAIESPPLTPPVAATPPPPSTYRIPDHLEVGNQVFDGSLSGFRTYLDTKRTTDPQMFAQLDPQVQRLESRKQTGRNIAIAGLVVGLASAVYAFAGQSSCSEPAVTDPNFGAKMQAWGDCNSANGTHILIFSLIGGAAVVAGGLTALALYPNRSDMLNLINEHNRISHEPIRLQLGYDPTSRVALGGLSTQF